MPTRRLYPLWRMTEELRKKCTAFNHILCCLPSLALLEILSHLRCIGWRDPYRVDCQPPVIRKDSVLHRNLILPVDGLGFKSSMHVASAACCSNWLTSIPVNSQQDNRVQSEGSCLQAVHFAFWLNAALGLTLLAHAGDAGNSFRLTYACLNCCDFQSLWSTP